MHPSNEEEIYPLARIGICGPSQNKFMPIPDNPSWLRRLSLHDNWVYQCLSCGMDKINPRGLQRHAEQWHCSINEDRRTPEDGESGLKTPNHEEARILMAHVRHFSFRKRYCRICLSAPSNIQHWTSREHVSNRVQTPQLIWCVCHRRTLDDD